MKQRRYWEEEGKEEMNNQKIIKTEDFSVVTSVYKSDNPTYFDRAFESIYTLQTVKPSEIVLVVDGPVPEEINKVIGKYQAICGAVLNVIRLKNNGGLGNALRIAVENSSYELIARMDSDDISVPNRFEQQLAVMKANRDVDIVGGDISEFIDEESRVVATRKVPCDDTGIKEYMKTRCAMNHVSVMYKKSAVLKAGGYLDLFWNEDYYLWIRMVEHGCKMANTGTVLVNVRTGTDMYKRRGGAKYFASEKFLQKYMLERKIITHSTYMMNLSKRFVIQRLLPNSIRGFVFKTFARS